MISFWDAERGLLGTGSDQYPPDKRYCYGTVSLTTDGGHSFRVVLRTHGIVGWVDTEGREDAWAQVDQCGQRHRQVRRQLLHTNDGGQSWKRLPPSALHLGDLPAGIWQPSFATSTEGLASLALGGQDARLVADTGNLAATSDGGRSWHRTEPPCRHSDGVAVSFPSPAAAWAVCTQTPGAGSQDKTILTSTDGGDQWHRIVQVSLEHANRGGLSEGGYIQSLPFSETGLGFLLSDLGAVYRTEDGGYQWQSFVSHADRTGQWP
jgi:hypothetical protein